MALRGPWRWILPVLLFTTSVMARLEPTQQANMESSDCDKQGAYTVKDSDVLQVYARPPQIPGGTSTRDHCIVEVRTEANRRLRIYVLDYSFNDYGTFVGIYDGTNHLVTPNYIVGRGSPFQDQYDSRTESVQIKLSKQSAASLSFRFTLAITTDQGPDIGFEQDMATYNPNILSIGAIVGLAIAGGLLLVALLAIAIYCMVKQRKKNMDAEKAQPVESSVYTSVPVDERRARRERYEMSRPKREYV